MNTEVQNRTLTVYNVPSTPLTLGIFILIMSSVIKEVKLTPKEKVVMDAIDTKGEFVWSSISQDDFKSTLKELMWKEYIQRKKVKGLHGNVFVAGWFFKMIMTNNKAYKILNQ